MTDPYNMVWPEIAIGGLLAYGEPLKQFGFIMNVAWEIADYEECEKTADGIPVHHARLDDNFDIEPQVPEIMRAVMLLRFARVREERALVTCAAGRNRSSLVVAEYLIQSGHDADLVIATIRAKRDNSLGNHVFVRWLRRAR